MQFHVLLSRAAKDYARLSLCGGINRPKANGGREGGGHKKRDTLRVRAAKGLSQQQEEEAAAADEEGNMQIRHRSPQDTGNMRQWLQQLSHYGHATPSQ